MGVVRTYRELARQFDSVNGTGAARRDALATLATLVALGIQMLGVAVIFGDIR